MNFCTLLYVQFDWVSEPNFFVDVSNVSKSWRFREKILSTQSCFLWFRNVNREVIQRNKEIKFDEL